MSCTDQLQDSSVVGRHEQLVAGRPQTASLPGACASVVLFCLGQQVQSDYLRVTSAIRFAPMPVSTKQHLLLRAPCPGNSERRFFSTCSFLLVGTGLVIYLAISRNNPSLAFSLSQTTPAFPGSWPIIASPRPITTTFTYQEPFSSLSIPSRLLPAQPYPSDAHLKYSTTQHHRSQVIARQLLWKKGQ